MEEKHFIEGSRASWERLAKAVEESRARGIESLSVARIRVMHDDYRRAAADLAYAQTHYPRSETTAYLNRLVGQAHGELYGSRPSRLRGVWRFLVAGFPALVREHRREVATAAALLFIPAALAYLLAFFDYPLAYALVPGQYQQSMGDIARGSVDVETLGQLAPALSIFIMVNNIQVGFLAFAGGISAGVLTGYALIRNGLLLGAIAGLYSAAGYDMQFWALIIPHGLLELFAICIAGGSGLVMAKALLLPGERPRVESLRRSAPDAVRLVLGTIPLFVVAGLIEGFVTLLPVAQELKMGVGVLVFAIALLYVALAGKSQGSATEGRAP
ncbi:MAG: stage II sporulation protein M [Coriobacteriia bacterium]